MPLARLTSSDVGASARAKINAIMDEADKVAGKQASFDLAALQATVSANALAVSTKASQSSVDALAATVAAKADQGTVAAISTKVDQNTVALAGKASQSALDTTTAQVAGKASQASVDALSGQYASLATTVGGKASQTALDAVGVRVDGKASQSLVESLNDSLKTKVNLTSLDAEADARRNADAALTEAVADVTQTLGEETDARAAKDQDLQEQVDLKLPKADVQSLRGRDAGLYAFERPADGPWYFTADAGTKDPDAYASLDIANAIDGSYRLRSEGYIVSKKFEAVEPDDVYPVRFAFTRSAIPTDPSGDTLRAGLLCYNAQRQLLSELTLRDWSNAPVGARQNATFLVSRSGVTGIADLVVLPPGAVRVRPFVRAFGGAQQTDVEVISWNVAGRGGGGSAPEAEAARNQAQLYRDQTAELRGQAAAIVATVPTPEYLVQPGTATGNKFAALAALLNGGVANLAGLLTTAKGNIVSALNEVFLSARRGGRAPTSNGTDDTVALQAFFNDTSSTIKDLGGQKYIVRGWDASDPTQAANASKNWVFTWPPHVKSIENGDIEYVNPRKVGLPLFDARNDVIAGGSLTADVLYPSRIIPLPDVTNIKKGMSIFLKANNTFGGSVPSTDPKVGEWQRVISVDIPGKTVTVAKPVLTDYKVANGASVDVFVGPAAPSDYTGPQGPFSAPGALRYPLIDQIKISVRAKGPGMDSLTNEKFLHLLRIPNADIIESSWLDFNGYGCSIERCGTVFSDRCRGERNGSYGHVITSGCESVLVKRYVSYREFVACESGGTTQGINRSVIYSYCEISYSLDAALNFKYATAYGGMFFNQAFGDLGEKLDAGSNEIHASTAFRSRAGRVKMFGNMETGYSKGAEVELQAASLGGGCEFDVRANTFDFSLDYALTIVNNDPQISPMNSPAAKTPFKGRVVDNTFSNMRNFLDDASTLASAAIFLRGFDGVLDNIDVDGNKLPNCDAHGISLLKSTNGAATRIRIGRKNVIDLSDSAKAAAIATQTVTFDPSTNTIVFPAPHGALAGTYIQLANTDGALPSGLVKDKNLIVCEEGLTANALKVSNLSAKGPIIVFTGTGSGTSQAVGVTPRKKINVLTGTSQVLPDATDSWSLPIASSPTLGIVAARRLPDDFFLVGVRAELLNAQASGSALTVNVLANGVTVLSTKLSFVNGETVAVNGIVNGVINRNLLKNARITASVDQVGAGATGLEVTLLGFWTP